MGRSAGRRFRRVSCVAAVRRARGDPQTAVPAVERGAPIVVAADRQFSDHIRTVVVDASTQATVVPAPEHCQLAPGSWARVVIAALVVALTSKVVSPELTGPL